MLTLAYGHFFDGPTDFIQREAWVSIQCQTRQHAFFIVSGKTNDAEFVIDCLYAGCLQIILKKMVDEGGFPG